MVFDGVTTITFHFQTKVADSWAFIHNTEQTV
jgi:hypothetical protein